MYWELRFKKFNTLSLTICFLVSKDFPLPRSAWPICFITLNEKQLGHASVHIIYRSYDNNNMTYIDAFQSSGSVYEYHWSDSVYDFWRLFT